LGIGDWAQSPIPNPQSPIPNPHLFNDKIILFDFNILNFFYFLIKEFILKSNIIKNGLNYYQFDIYK